MSKLRPKDVKGTTVMDRIFKAFLGNNLNTLSEEDKNILERISLVDAKVRTGQVVIKTKYDPNLGADVEVDRYNKPYQKSELAKWMMQHFGISMAQAYVDIDMSERFFLTTESRKNKEFGRGMHIYWGEEAMAEARHAGDFKSAAAFFKELSKIKDLYVFDDGLPKLKDFRPIEPVIVTDASELGFDKIDNLDETRSRLQIELRARKSSLDRILDDESEDDDLDEEENGRD